MIQIDFKYTYPTISDDIFVDGIYEYLIHKRSIFINYFYENVDTQDIDYIYISSFNTGDLYKGLTKSLKIVIVTKNKIENNIFIITPQNKVIVCSKNYYCLVPLLKNFQRNIKIKAVLD